MLLYADEDFSLPVVEERRRLDHDVLTAQEDGHTSITTPSTTPPRRPVGKATFASCARPIPVFAFRKRTRLW